MFQFNKMMLGQKTVVLQHHLKSTCVASNVGKRLAKVSDTSTMSNRQSKPQIPPLHTDSILDVDDWSPPRLLGSSGSAATANYDTDRYPQPTEPADSTLDEWIPPAPYMRERGGRHVVAEESFGDLWDL